MERPRIEAFGSIFPLSDYFVALRGQEVSYTWSPCQSASRLDIFYCCAALDFYVINCGVFPFFVDVAFISDHRTVCFELSLPAPPFISVAHWRFDVSMICDVVALTSFREDWQLLGEL